MLIIYYFFGFSRIKADLATNGEQPADLVTSSSGAVASTTSVATSSTSTTSGGTTNRPLLTLVADPARASSLATARRATKATKEVSLNTSCPARQAGYELKMVVQPENQHRARYMTEGSRGAVKDESQEGHPKVKVSWTISFLEITHGIGSNSLSIAYL